MNCPNPTCTEQEITKAEAGIWTCPNCGTTYGTGEEPRIPTPSLSVDRDGNPLKNHGMMS